MDALKLGIDVGGTFTDFFLWSPPAGVETYKVLTTPGDPSAGVRDGLERIAHARGTDLGSFVRSLHSIVHGTTVTTNAVLTRNGAKTALLTTAGFRDALQMRRGIREERYDNRYTNVVPLVPRYLRRPVKERMGRTGEAITPLDDTSLCEAVAHLEADGVEAVAICFLNAFSNAAHEATALEAVRHALPEAWACASSEVLPVVRFYERVSTTVLNAYVGPVLRDYLARLEGMLKEAGFEGILLIMQSGGGVASPEATARTPAATLLSGPAAGPRAALAYTLPMGRRDSILVDMGGTSFDASLVRDGAAALTTSGEIDRLRVALPMLDILTIGAGGGSVGWMDEGGLLRVGPRSAGASPGPACYGRGGTEPTCTDADLVLGYLDPRYFAGGTLTLDREKAERAIDLRIARPLGLDIEQAAAGMYRVINANMAHGVREITVKRGLDPREFPLVVGGGAGPLHACAIANELQIPTVVIPAAASILCAAGMVLCDLEHDQVRTFLSPFATLEAARLRGLVLEMVRAGADRLAAEGIPASLQRHIVILELRYMDQYHELFLEVPMEVVSAGDLLAIRRAFHQAHDRLYGYELSSEKTDLELINVRIRSRGETLKPSLPRIGKGPADAGAARKGERRAFLPESRRFAAVPVFDGHALSCGNRIEGPALVERTDTTLFLTESFVARVDELGTVLCERLTSEEG